MLSEDILISQNSEVCNSNLWIIRGKIKSQISFCLNNPWMKMVYDVIYNGSAYLSNFHLNMIKQQENREKFLVTIYIVLRCSQIWHNYLKMFNSEYLDCSYFSYRLVGDSSAVNEVFVFTWLIIHFLMVNFSFPNTDVRKTTSTHRNPTPGWVVPHHHLSTNANHRVTTEMNQMERK